MTTTNAPPALLRYFENKNVLITGGLGFIGSNLAIALVRLGANVTIQDSLSPTHGGNKHNIFPIEQQVKLVLHSCNEFDTLRQSVANADVIYHLAGQTSHSDSMKTPIDDVEANVFATVNLLEACKQENNQAKIVFTSTRQVYGKPKFLPVDENHELDAIDVNAINKMASEQYLKLYFNLFKIKSTILRITNTYGPRIKLSGNNQGFLGIFLRQALLGEEIFIYGDGTQLRDFLYVNDAVDALLWSPISNPCESEIYNIGSNAVMSIKDFLSVLSKIIPLDCRIVDFPSDRLAIDIGDYYSDFSKFKKNTNWHPNTSVELGLSETIEYYQEHIDYYV